MNSENNIVEIKLSLDEVNLVLQALSKLPLEVVLNTFFSIKQQAENNNKG